jgi:ubiquitin-protein ligase
MRALQPYFPQFRCLIGRGKIYFTGTLTTNEGNPYVIRVDLPDNYPASMPHSFVLSPNPLPSYGGYNFMKATHEMHCWSPDDQGNVQMCLYHPKAWTPNDTIYHIIMKARFWLEAYERHVKTHLPMNRLIKDMPEPQ